MFAKLLLSFAFFQIAFTDFTFRDVIVTCDVENPQNEESFGALVTSNRLKPHLPSNQKCDKIEIQYANIPTLQEDSLSELTHVNYLLLESNKIEHIASGAFKNSKIKEVVSLKYNKLREIRRGVFNELQVKVIFLGHNSISYIDYQAFDGMTMLESVHLDHNQLSRINTFWFKNTPKLTKLSLHYNVIEEIPANAFGNVVRRRSPSKIDLSHNRIRRVDRDAFANSKKLHFLGLAHNQIQDLDRNWLKGVKIDVLDLSNNRIRCLRFGLAEPFGTNLVDGNPWDCACLEEVNKKKELGVFGEIEAEKAFIRCNIF